MGLCSLLDVYTATQVFERGVVVSRASALGEVRRDRCETLPRPFVTITMHRKSVVCAASTQPRASTSCDGWATTDAELWRGNLWGTVVEHTFGWRAQFAYPKTLVLPFEIVLIGINEAVTRLKGLTAYGADILIDDVGKMSPSG